MFMLSNSTNKFLNYRRQKCARIKIVLCVQGENENRNMYQKGTNFIFLVII